VQCLSRYLVASIKAEGRQSQHFRPGLGKVREYR